MNNAVYTAWRSGDDAHGRWVPVGKLEHREGGFRFLYTRGAQQHGFQPFPGMPDLHAVYESETLFPIFTNRLLSKSRPEYDAYLTWSGFDPHDLPDPLAVLGVTEGIRQTDSLEVFPCPLPDADGCYLTKFFVHGIRWQTPDAIERIDQLQPGETLELQREPENPFDASAVLVRTLDEISIGYVPRYMAYEIGLLSDHCDPDFIDVEVERVNQGAPLQMRVLCRMKACWPEGFRPCTGEEFQPIVNESAYIGEVKRA